ncbi:MAG TPA: pyruvate dehydrogenase (acetyl-transferring) E1 component subunit alpha [Thermoanaerobaculia bacterium]|nr:pyruvate dehydrogenase (acetyl-transferring) E1 component subunit alpha [Thermoanaerobaculia bacterium]
MATKKDQQTATATVDETVYGPEWNDILRQMILIRRFEEATEREFRRGRIGGYLHVYIGQEAVGSGILTALEKGDIVYSGYRDHAHCLALGSEPGRIMAELFGKSTGLSKGKGGSMHLFDVERGFYGGYGIVGGHLTLATGSAYALRFRGTDRIAVCYFGDGAMNIGSFHEAMNMAGLWGKDGMCPILFVIENNGYAMGTSVERHSALTDLSARVRAYNIPSEKVDGQDVFAVRAAADRIVRQVRETGRPYCLEAVTYRFSGHGAADVQQPYRSKDEVEQHKHRDPILILRNRLAEAAALTDDDEKKMEQWAADTVAQALKFAEESPVPDPSELFTDVVAENAPHAVADDERN